MRHLLDGIGIICMAGVRTIVWDGISGLLRLLSPPPQRYHVHLHIAETRTGGPGPGDNPKIGEMGASEGVKYA